VPAVLLGVQLNATVAHGNESRLTSMKRYLAKSTNLRVGPIAAAVLLCLFSAALHSPARAANRLISQPQLQRLGLTRAWFAQVRMNPARSRVERAILTGNRLTVLTSAGVVQEFDAETGSTLWAAPIGNENYPSLGPAANDKFVALLNGSTLYVLDRADGRPTIIQRVGGAPGAAPALAPDYVFVPLVKGRIEGYPLSTESKVNPWYYQASGRMMVAPLATPASVVFTTDSGNLYVGYSDKPGMRFRLETGSEIIAPPAYQKPYVYAASESGEVFAMDELTGERRWKYSTGFPVERAPAPVGKRVFVTSAEPALHCIDAETGDGLWEAPNMKQFAAASKARVYGVDALGAFVALDGANGNVVGRILVDHPIRSLVNKQNDRVYLVSEEGVVECLHDIDAKTPFEHSPEPAPDATKPGADAKKPAAGTPPATAPAVEEASPFDDVAPPAATPPATPPATPEKPPGPAVPDDENPFGG
jgi:outer membrane protein assembly factor BamB